MPDYHDDAMNHVETVQIASGQPYSTAVYLGQRSIAGIGMSAAWDAAVMAFQGSFDGVTWQDIYIGGVEYTEVVVAAKACIPTSSYLQWPYVRLASGPTAGRVNQTALRIINLVLRRFSVRSST
jgi:hypothetical protein